MTDDKLLMLGYTKKNINGFEIHKKPGFEQYVFLDSRGVRHYEKFDSRTRIRKQHDIVHIENDICAKDSKPKKVFLTKEFGLFELKGFKDQVVSCNELLVINKCPLLLIYDKTTKEKYTFYCDFEIDLRTMPFRVSKDIYLIGDVLVNFKSKIIIHFGRCYSYRTNAGYIAIYADETTIYKSTPKEMVVIENIVYSTDSSLTKFILDLKDYSVSVCKVKITDINSVRTEVTVLTNMLTKIKKVTNIDASSDRDTKERLDRVNSDLVHFE